MTKKPNNFRKYGKRDRMKRRDDEDKLSIEDELDDKFEDDDLDNGVIELVQHWHDKSTREANRPVDS